MFCINIRFANPSGRAEARSGKASDDFEKLFNNVRASKLAF